MISQFLLEYLYEDYILLIMIIGLWIVLVPNSPAIKKDKQFLKNLSLIIILMSIFTRMEISLGELPYPTRAHVIVSWICYSFKPCVIILPLSLHMSHTLKYRLMWLFPLINCLVYATALFSPIAFTYDENNVFIRGPLGFTVHIISVICLVQFVYYASQNYGGKAEKSQYILVFIMVVGLGSVCVETFLSRYCINETVIICCYAYYLYLHIHYANELLEEQKKRLRDQRDALMISQIQPHFMYNTLNIIYFLCRKNPQLAGDTVLKFSDYLRNNLDVSANPDRLIPFEQELKHTKIYSDIEMLRFENISVEYKVDDKDFLVPALCVQPMVENAIKHGVRGREHGVVIISSYFDGKNHVIEIKDNGIGYVKPQTNVRQKTHIGIKNVRERIEKMCLGTFDIHMVRDVGTTVIMKIPEEQTE
ncbi:MAG: histidine kinase [Lachnospiraceae bacterium]|nr:histidine kinase [Lachnospiraceae bacterium]